jgi:hypothetical protein
VTELAASLVYTGTKIVADDRMRIFVVCLLAAPALAAPIPDEAKFVGWSEPADGVRVRLTTAKVKYKVGEPLKLTLELCEVAGKNRLLAEPELEPIISYPRSHPYRSDDFPWVITADRVGGNPKVLWDRRATGRKDAAEVRLAAGTTYRVEITTLPPGTEPPPDRAREKGEPQLEVLEFAAAGESGAYSLRATYARPAGLRRDAAGDNSWPARIETPAVRIEIVE